MSRDPQRLRDDPRSPAGLRALMKDASPPPAMNEATRAASAAALATLVTSQAAAAAATATAAVGASAGIKLWLVVGGVALTGMVGAGLALSPTPRIPAERTETPPPSQTPASADVAESTPPVTVVPPAGPAEPPSDTLAEQPLSETIPPEVPASNAPSRASARSRDAATQGEGASSENEGGLVAEAALLERARRLLATDPAGALAETTRHARSFPRPRLAAERDIIAIDALRRLGRSAAARRRARRLISRAPNGIYADRARAILGDLSD